MLSHARLGQTTKNLEEDEISAADSASASPAKETEKNEELGTDKDNEDEQKSVDRVIEMHKRAQEERRREADERAQQKPRLAHCPFFPLDVHESWWLFVIEGQQHPPPKSANQQQQIPIVVPQPNCIWEMPKRITDLKTSRRVRRTV
jgi:hypothetical protein